MNKRTYSQIIPKLRSLNIETLKKGCDCRESKLTFNRRFSLANTPKEWSVLERECKPKRKMTTLFPESKLVYGHMEALPNSKK